jgi:UDP-N-acetylenolpyruvoylglucosamine reductase
MNFSADKLPHEDPAAVGRRVFMGGIGGMGMAALAIYLRQMGDSVTGFDDRMGPETAFLLRRCGVEVVPRPEHLPHCDAFVYTAALRESDPLLLEARATAGVAACSRGAYLAKILAGNRLLAVVGSHGKTTTTAYLISILRARDFPFNYLLGGRLDGPNVPAHYCGAEWTVAEIDESEPSIELFSPHITLALNLSLDHDAHYASIEVLRAAFRRLFMRTERHVVLARDEPTLEPFHGIKKVHFFSQEQPLHATGGEKLSPPFNRHNCAAAVAAADLLCPSPLPWREEVSVQRRQSRLFFSGDCEILSDYAHHPREIGEFLQFYWGPRTALIFQPHRYSRTVSHLGEFLAVLAAHSPAVLMPTYGAFEAANPLGSGEYLSEQLAKSGHAVPCLDGERLLSHIRDLRDCAGVRRFLFVGAGTIGAVGESCARRFSEDHFLQLCGNFGLECPLVENFPMARCTSLRVGGPARFFAEPRTLHELRLLLLCARQANLKHFILGSGTNLLVDDGGFFGLVLRPRGNFWERYRLGRDEIYARGSLSLRKLSHLCGENSIGGYEFCDGIPGTVGGAIRMNAGAFGGSIGDSVLEMTTLDRDGKIDRWTAGKFSYRQSPLPAGAILLSVRLSGKRSADCGDEILLRRNAIAKMRRERQPRGPSAGSTFRNPPGMAAGKLIDEAGLRGFQIGAAQISPQHGNFIVNRGGACCDHILSLIFYVKRIVKERFKVDLGLEVCYLADFWEGPF